MSKQSFPLCMRHLHETLRSTHHLKHGGRMQYGLFIKGIGLSLEHSLKFWREEFTKNMDIDKVGPSIEDFVNTIPYISVFPLVRKAICVQYSPQLRQGRKKNQLRTSKLHQNH